MLFASMLVIVFYLAKGRKNNASRWLAILATASCLQTLFSLFTILTLHKPVFGRYTNNYIVCFYLVLEAICSLIFIRVSIVSPTAKKLLFVTAALFVTYCAALWMVYNDTLKFIPNAKIVESIVLVVACLYYFYELFTQVPDKNLSTDPGFWSISGILILSGTDIPLFLFLNSIFPRFKPISDNLYAINYVSYTLLFAMFLISILLYSQNESPGKHEAFTR
jgi:hypothetical protein